MYIGNQTTILNPVYFFGKPKNSQKVVNVKILPADVDTGIVFKRTDLKENNIIKLSYDNMVIENDNIILKNNNISISNVENLLASIWADRLDNVIIELDGDAIPYIDGTSEPISFLLTTARIKEFEKARNVFELNENVSVKIGSSEINLKKGNGALKIKISNEFNSFEFDNGILPFKDTLSTINEDGDKLKLDTISTLVIIFIGGKYCNFDVEFKNFNKKVAYEFFKNILK